MSAAKLTPEGVMRRHHALQRKRPLLPSVLLEARRAMFAGKVDTEDVRERDAVRQWERAEVDALACLTLAGIESATSPGAAMNHAVAALDAERAAWRAQFVLDVYDAEAATLLRERNAEQREVDREFRELLGWADESDE